jgi:hypothetical protein
VDVAEPELVLVPVLVPELVLVDVAELELVLVAVLVPVLVPVPVPVDVCVLVLDALNVDELLEELVEVPVPSTYTRDPKQQ